MKKITLLLFSLLMICVTSCKKDTEDVTDLLKSVPSSAAGVVVIDVENILEDAGCKVKDHEVNPSPEVAALAENIEKRGISAGILLNGDTGIEPKAAVVFYDSNRAFLTVALHDVAKFCDYVVSKFGGLFREESGVKINDRIAVKGSQAWICLSARKEIDADAISSYASLSESQSFLVTPIGEKLLVEENDIRGWAMIDTFTDYFLNGSLQGMIDRSTRNMFALGMGFLFEDAESLKFKADFKKGEFEAEGMLLNSKLKPAKYALPTNKVDVASLKAMGGTCDAMMAFTLSPDLIKKFSKLSKAMGGMIFGNITELMANVDGTVGIATGGEGMGSSVKGFVTTKGEMSKMLKDLISDEIGPVSVDGNLVKFSRGDVKGTIDIAETAEDLKGCCLGFVFDNSVMSSYGVASGLKGFDKCIFTLEGESGSLELEMKFKTRDKNVNSLIEIIRGMN